MRRQRIVRLEERKGWALEIHGLSVLTHEGEDDIAIVQVSLWAAVAGVTSDLLILVQLKDVLRVLQPFMPYRVGDICGKIGCRRA